MASPGKQLPGIAGAMANRGRAHGGALISARSLPPLHFDHKHLTTVIDFTQCDSSEMSSPLGISLFVDRESQDKTRSFLKEPSPTCDRRFLASIKRIYGAAFSGYNPSLAQDEASVIEALVTAAEECSYPTSKSLQARHAQLSASTRRVMESLHRLLDYDVEVYLKRFASILLNPRFKLRWHLMGNNCQNFVDGLLKGKDFEYLFPRLPERFLNDQVMRQSLKFPWPRYLISFHDQIDGLGTSRTRPQSVVRRFYKDNRDRCDLVEFARLAYGHAATDEAKDGEFNIVGNELLLTPDVISDENAKEYGLTEKLLDDLWEMPRDSMSLLQSHLFRPAEKYSDHQGFALTGPEWLANRLRILRQMDLFASLAGGLGSALLAVFCSNPSILRELGMPHARVMGTCHADDVIFASQIAMSKVYSYVIRDKKERKENASNIGRKKTLVTCGLNIRDLENITAVEVLSEYSPMVTAFLMGFDVTLNMSQFLAHFDSNGWFVYRFMGNFVFLYNVKRRKSLRREKN